VGEPYYSDGLVTIYHGDCREVMSALPDVDCVITSPPYNTLPATNNPSGLHGPKGGRGKWVKKAAEGYADQRDEVEYQEWMLEILSRAFELCRGLMWVNHKTRFRDGVGIHPARMFPWPIYSEVIWDRRGSMALNAKRFAPSHEFLLAFGSPHWWDDNLNTRMTVWRIAPVRGSDHPCPFPRRLISAPIASSCPPDGVVLDPFMGSGTALDEAKRLGRRSIGIEIEERYCEIAADRCSQGVLALGS